MIKNFIVLRIYRILRWRFVYLKNRIKEKKKKHSDNKNTTSFEDIDTNEGKGWKSNPMICVKCLHRSWYVYRNGTHRVKNFECNYCGRIGSLIIDQSALDEIEGE